VNGTIALLLAQDGLTNGIIYAMVAIAILLVYLVTRVLLVPQGEFVTLGALTLVELQKGHPPSAFWLVFAVACATLVVAMVRAWWGADWRRLPGVLAFCSGAIALGASGLAVSTFFYQGASPPFAVCALVAVALVAPLGPMLYWTAFEGISRSSVLTLLFAAVALHYVLQGVMLPVFGAEGFQAEAAIRGRIDIGVMRVSVQLILVAAVFVVTLTALWLFFKYAIMGKILRATAVNSRGARLVGIRPETSGALAFGFASLIGAVSGILIAPLTTLYYDSGFLLALKGFVGGVIGGLASFPLAAGGSLLVGVLEALFSFQLSALKESLVFTVLIPILLVNSFGRLSDRDTEDEA
jgi:branched-chain amino acid transport system permease protein